MELNFIPECYFDTVLVKNILKVKKVNHQKNCFKVENAIKTRDFAVGIIDRDKIPIKYLNECILEIRKENLYLWKHKTKSHYIIQLVPALEKWILKIITEEHIIVEDLNLPQDFKAFKDDTKYSLVRENEELHRLCKRLAGSNSETMQTLSKWLNYLYKNNRNADINTLKENV